ncbi:hypothetical protein [Bacillus amyloliquefaciens]|uniref:hypothetical protein n=1 Tax=Bacillus amyloliquefaciens TaxID=1390 RepID=UPI002E1F0386|nr:hypothetical protein [Bacillus amyloliquefaciens]
MKTTLFPEPYSSMMAITAKKPNNEHLTAAALFKSKDQVFAEIEPEAQPEIFFDPITQREYERKMSKDIKIWRGSEILWAFDRKDIAAIKEIPEGSRVELKNGDWFNSGHSVEEMKNILGLTPDKQLEILKKNIKVLSLTHGSLLRETQFAQGVRHAIDEILKHTGMTIETLLEEQREKEKKQND